MFKADEQLKIHREKAGKDINDVLSCARDAVFTTGASVAVVGGAARDMALGGAPRDVDLMICPRNEDDVYVLLSALDIDLGYKITADYLHDGDCTLCNSLPLAEFYDTVDGSDDRLSRVVKLASPGRLNVDVLVSSDSTIREAVARFDYNINQFVIRRAGAAYPMYVGDTPAGTLHIGRSGYISTERTAHMHKIATAYNWSI